MTEDEVVGWHHQLTGHELEQDLGVGDGQGSLECCSPWGHKYLDVTELLNRTDNLHTTQFALLNVLFMVYSIFMILCNNH